MSNKFKTITRSRKFDNFTNCCMFFSVLMVVQKHLKLSCYHARVGQIFWLSTHSNSNNKTLLMKLQQNPIKTNQVGETSLSFKVMAKMRQIYDIKTPWWGWNRCKEQNISKNPDVKMNNRTEKCLYLPKWRKTRPHATCKNTQRWKLAQYCKISHSCLDFLGLAVGCR